MILRRILLLASSLAVAATLTAADPHALLALLALPAPVPALAATYGEHCQRSLALLAGSTAERRRTVRVLFYGQSITQPAWTELVAADLRARFPHADVVYRNLALGGFASQLLVRTAPADVLGFQPDLFVFHVYGGDAEYAEIIRLVRERTTADIVLQTDHIVHGEWDAAKAVPRDPAWTVHMNREVIPRLGRELACAVEPQRDEWAAYLALHGLAEDALLRDGVHLDRHGERLMAALLSRFLALRPEGAPAAEAARVRLLEIGRDASWTGGRLRIPFTGSRVVAFALPGRGSATVRIDGQPPSAIPALLLATRPSGCHGIAGWPALKRAELGAGAVAETWTATCSGFDATQEDFAFTVVGSATGADGAGRGRQPFTSTSGRLRIAPGDWDFAYDLAVAAKSEPARARTPEGFTVTWRVETQGVDTYRPPVDADPAGDNQVVLASGLADGDHVLELVAEDASSPPPLRAIAVHHPGSR